MPIIILIAGQGRTENNIFHLVLIAAKRAIVILCSCESLGDFRRANIPEILIILDDVFFFFLTIVCFLKVPNSLNSHSIKFGFGKTQFRKSNSASTPS